MNLIKGRPTDILFLSLKVVLQRANLRQGGKDKAEDQVAYHLQLAQLVAVTILLAAV